jgi:hypothetical protein
MRSGARPRETRSRSDLQALAGVAQASAGPRGFCPVAVYVERLSSGAGSGANPCRAPVSFGLARALLRLCRYVAGLLPLPAVFLDGFFANVAGLFLPNLAGLLETPASKPA